MLNNQTSLLILFAASVGIWSSAQAQVVRSDSLSTCTRLPVDTAGWRAQESWSFELGFMAPARYHAKYWAVRWGPPSDKEDWWPVGSVQWTFSFRTETLATLPSPYHATHYAACHEPWSGRDGKIEQYDGEALWNGSSRVPSYWIRGVWPLAGTRLLVFESSGADSTVRHEMFALLQSLRFLRARQP